MRSPQVSRGVRGRGEEPPNCWSPRDLVSVSLLPVHPMLTAARGVLLTIPILQTNKLRRRRLKLLPTVTWLPNGGQDSSSDPIDPRVHAISVIKFDSYAHRGKARESKQTMAGPGEPSIDNSRRGGAWFSQAAMHRVSGARRCWAHCLLWSQCHW